MQKTYYDSSLEYPKYVVDTSDTRQEMYKRNSLAEAEPTQNAGYRALSSLQMCNNEHIVKSLLPNPIFSQGYEPQDVQVVQADGTDMPNWNLIYNYGNEFDTPHSRDTQSNTTPLPFSAHDILALDDTRTVDDNDPSPIPAVNPIMGQVGDVILMSSNPVTYTRHNPTTDELETYEVTSPRTQNNS
jgi:hypothetical protein